MQRREDFMRAESRPAARCGRGRRFGEDVTGWMACDTSVGSAAAPSAWPSSSSSFAQSAPPADRLPRSGLLASLP